MSEREAARHLVWAGARARGLATIAVRLLGFATSALLIRSLAREQVGVFFIALSAAAVLGPLLAFGLPETVARTTAALDAVGQDPRASGIARTALLVSFGAVGAGVLLAFGLAVVLDADPSRFTATAVLSGLLSVGALASALLRTRGRVMFAETTQVAAAATFLVLVAALVPAMPISGGGLVWIRSVVEAGAVAVLVILAMRATSGREGRSRIRPVLATSAPLWVAGFSWLALQNADVLLLGTLEGSTAVGTYAPILRTADLSIVALGMLGAYVLPAASRFHALGRTAEIQALYGNTSLVGFALSSPVLAALALAPDATMHWLFGIEGSAVAPTARILACAYTVNAAFGLNGVVLQAIGRVRDLAYRSLIVLLVGVVACLVLIPPFGMKGAAISTLVSFVGLNAANSFILLRRHGIRPFGREMVLTIAAGAGATGAAALVGGGEAGGIVLGVEVVAIGAVTLGVAWGMIDSQTRLAIRAVARRGVL